jgi:uncharacterized protein (DUF934 family)
MAKIFRHGRIAALPEHEPVVRLAQWQGESGVLLGPGDDPQAIADHLHEIEVIAVEFPQFTDGRGYSIARLLRERHGFKGEIRAVGEVLRDNLFYLSRCGFDSFVLSDQSRLDEAIADLSTFSDAYQASVERPQPLFRRRGPAPAEALGQ